MLKIQKLKNNLRFITVPMRGTKTATILVMIGTGSKYENRKNNGISHFMEHMFFKGTKKRSNTLAIVSELDAVGAEFNAFTSKEYTGYVVKIDATKIDLAMDIISDILLNSKFKTKEIEKEKGVIVEEINMDQDDPRSYVGGLFEKCLYGDQPAGWEVLGTKKSILKFKRKDFTDYLKTQYGSENMVVCIAGNIGDKKKNINKYFSKFRQSSLKNKIVVKEKQIKPNTLVHYKKTDQAHLLLGVRTFSIGHKDEFALKVLSAILGGSFSSRLVLELREKKGLCYYVYTNVENYTDTGYLATQTGVPVNKIDEAIGIILKEYKKLKNGLVDKKELNRVKDMIKGRANIGLEASDNVANWYANRVILRNKISTPEEYLKKIQEVSARDIQRVAKEIFVNKGLNLSIVGPYKNSKNFDKLLKL